MIIVKKLFFLFPLLFLLTICSEKTPIPEEKLILIYIDLMFAQDTLLITTDNVDSLKSEVFQRHKITEDDYKTTLEHYNKSPERWEIFFDKVIDYVESLKTKSQDSD